MRIPIKKYNLQHEGHIPLNVGFHTFRHTFASKLYYKYNITSKAIATYLGHYSREFTEKVYIKSYTEEQDDLVNCMEKDLKNKLKCQSQFKMRN